MSLVEREHYTPPEAETFRIPETSEQPVSEADAELNQSLAREAEMVLGRPADKISAIELGIIQFAQEQSHENQQLKDMVAQLQERLYTDSLTKLKSREYLNDILEQTATPRAVENEQRHIKEGEPSTAVLMIDLNGFKRINDEYGHEAGDLALKTVAQAIRGTLRTEDNAVALPEFTDSDEIRTGGDEFVVLLHNILPNDVESVAKRLQNAILRARFEVHDKHGMVIEESVGASIGIKMHRTGNSLRADIKEADDAMYAAKQRKEPEGSISIAADMRQGIETAQADTAEAEPPFVA
jgi:diguanylate cyclase (GGDEF)-like protein